jgi:nucleoside-diphosphate-sugar epimerase
MRPYPGDFIGGAVARALRQRGSSVAVFKRAATKPVGLEGVELVEGDLADAASVRAACERAGTVVFAAAYYPLISLNAAPQLEAARRQIANFFSAVRPEATVVYVSSISCIGTRAEVCDETTPLDPATLPEENRMMKLKRAVELVFKAHLGV